MSWLSNLAKNFGTLLFSFTLAVIVWAAAVVSSDPNQEGVFQAVPLEIVGQSVNLILTNEIPELANVTLIAPSSIWNQLSNDPGLVKTWIDLSGLDEGEHSVLVQTSIGLSPVRVESVDPLQVDIVLEKLTTTLMPVEINIIGEPPFGYEVGRPTIEPSTVEIVGAESVVSKISKASATLNIAGASQAVKASVPVRAVDQNGDLVPGLTITPGSVDVTQPINILGGYKNVAVKVVTRGQVADGYRLTNISVTPPTVTVYSSDPQLVNELPGFIETKPVDLSGLTDDVEFNADLNLPTGITLVSEPSVLVQVGIAAIEGSLTLSLPVESFGLQPGLAAFISPPTVDVIVVGPLPVLDTLTPASFRVVVDLTDLAIGVYQIKPVLDLAPDEVQVQAINPETVEVIVDIAPTPTPTPAGTPRPVVTPTLTPTVGRRP